VGSSSSTMVVVIVPPSKPFLIFKCINKLKPSEKIGHFIEFKKLSITYLIIA
jgi:hypothetical protein